MKLMNQVIYKYFSIIKRFIKDFTSTYFVEMLNDGDCVIDDDTTSVKIISPLESTSKIQECNLSTQISSPSKVSCTHSLINISLTKSPSTSPSKSELKKKIKTLQQRVRRQNKSIKNLKDLLKGFLKKEFN